VLSVPRLRTRTKDSEDGATRKPKILVTTRPPHHRVDYVDQLIGDDSAGGAPTGVIHEFSLDPLRPRDADVIHLTDVEKVIGGHRLPEDERTRRAKRFIKMLRRRGIALVRTVESPAAGIERSRAEATINRAAAYLIALNPTISAEQDVVVIPHSHLRDRFLGFPREEVRPGRMLITARGTLPPPYEAAVKVMAVADLPDWTLRVAGDVPTEAKESYARSLADLGGVMSLRDDQLSDAASVTEISQAEVVLVVEPDRYDSQSVILMALSLDRPVLVADTPAMQSLADEVGPGWVQRHPGPLTAVALETALREFRANPPRHPPQLDARDPNEISARYAAVFRRAIGHH